MSTSVFVPLKLRTMGVKKPLEEKVDKIAND
jgi:hypothetical protein